MKQENGFTLIELLAVIMLLSIIMVFIVPNILKLFGESNNRLTSFQTKQLEDAVELYIDDTCINPLGNTSVCEFTTSKDTDGNIIINNASMTLESFLTKGYLDSEGTLTECEGNILIENNKVDISNINCSS